MANKTQITGQDPADFIATCPHRQEDARALKALFDQVTGLPAQMWGASIIGYGRYAYRYDSGRSGEFLMTGFSPRKTALSIYILPGYRDLGPQLARLGKHKTGKSCLYINRMSDIDSDVLAEIIAEGLSYMRANYETFDR